LLAALLGTGAANAGTDPKYSDTGAGAVLGSAGSPPPGAVASVPGGNNGSASNPGSLTGIGAWEKYEVVYARLDADGAANHVYVVNNFDITNAGAVTDFGDYDTVLNLSDTEELVQKGDAVDFSADKGHFYYQGNKKTTELPWFFTLSFSLNGQKTPPSALAGASGALELHILSKQNDKADPTFYDNYMLQITVTLDSTKCGNIDAPGAMIAEAGKDRAVNYTVLPGKNADYTLRADVDDFEMSGIQISGVPYFMDLDVPEMDDQLDDLNKLPDAISELNDGVGDLLDGTKELKDGAHELVSGSWDIREGLSKLGSNSNQIVDASSQINKALAKIASSLSGGAAGGIDMSRLSGLAELSGTLTYLADALEDISDGLGQMAGGFSLSYAALDSAMAGIPTGTLSQEQSAEFMGGLDPAQQAIAAELIANYQAAQIAKGTYDAIKPGFDAVAVTVDALLPGLTGVAGALALMATELESVPESLSGLAGLGELVSGLQILSKNYSTFHRGLVSYMDGVKTLANNYGAFHDGLAEFDDGVGELRDGVGELRDGTKTLNKEVADLPDVLKDEIDKMKEQYMSKEFETVSFASPKNTHTVYVQFVLKSEEIKKPETEKTPPPEPQPLTLWDRLLALF
jgi:X-X-X-Leu-X-X-Gly heptad repeat protein